MKNGKKLKTVLTTKHTQADMYIDRGNNKKLRDYSQLLCVCCDHQFMIKEKINRKCFL